MRIEKEDFSGLVDKVIEFLEVAYDERGLDFSVATEEHVQDLCKALEFRLVTLLDDSSILDECLEFVTLTAEDDEDNIWHDFL